LTGDCKIELLRTHEDWYALQPSWDRILERQSAGIMDFDFTASFEWAYTLWQTHWDSRPIQALVMRKAGEIAAILPLYRLNKTVRRIPCRALSPIFELYSGRTGILLDAPDRSDLERFFSNLRSQPSTWDAFTMTVVQGSALETCFLQVVQAAGLVLQVLEELRSPYIPICNNWDTQFAGLPKKLRSTIRNGEKRLTERGTLSYSECRSPEDAKLFNVAVAEIERDSWKDSAGTSIAANPMHEAFHREMTVRAAERGNFSGHLLLLDEQPIAYVMGVLYNGVFLDLKESYRNSFREMSPGHVLKSFIFTQLAQRGATVFDFMGKCEDYKMKWTDKTYCRVTYLLLNDTLRGRAARWLGRIATSASKPETSRRLTASTKPHEQKQEPTAGDGSAAADGIRGAVGN